MVPGFPFAAAWSGGAVVAAVFFSAVASGAWPGFVVVFLAVVVFGVVVFAELFLATDLLGAALFPLVFLTALFLAVRLLAGALWRGVLPEAFFLAVPLLELRAGAFRALVLVFIGLPIGPRPLPLNRLA